MTHPVDRISHAEITESFFAFTDDFGFSTSETMNDPFPRELNEALFDSVSKLLLKESTPMSEAADISGRFGLNPEQAWKALELRRLYAYFLLDTDGRRVQLNGEGGPEQYAALAHALRMDLSELDIACERLYRYLPERLNNAVPSNVWVLTPPGPDCERYVELLDQARNRRSDDTHRSDAQRFNPRSLQGIPTLHDTVTAISGTWYVNEYRTNRCWGGPEEGGWYYPVGAFVKCHGEFESREPAETKIAELERDFLPSAREGLHEPGSVLCTGWPEIKLETQPGKDYPEEAPSYS